LAGGALVAGAGFLAAVLAGAFTAALALVAGLADFAVALGMMLIFLESCPWRRPLPALTPS
jgi:ribose/xylose/arabinose/galactoside ABC-type transport system permease subunit